MGSACYMVRAGKLVRRVQTNAEEEGEARGDSVHGDPASRAAPYVLEPVGDGQPQLQVGGSARFLHVVPGNRDAVELGHVPAPTCIPA